MSEEGELPPLTSEQTVAVIVTHHEIFCPDVERVITFPDLPPFPKVGDEVDDEVLHTWRRARSWALAMESVRWLTNDYSLHWYKLQFRRFEQVLSSVLTPAADPQVSAVANLIPHRLLE